MLNKNTLGNDLSAGLVVFLVALPLCLGIALASGTSAISGLIAGIIGGIVVGIISGSHLSVSGPAAGLTSIVLEANSTLGSFELFLSAIVLAGIFQILLGVFRAGFFGNYIPGSVIKGMLAAIGLILIMKQIPHALGYDFDPEGDESFIQSDGHNTLSEIIYSIKNISWTAFLLALFSLGILVLWTTKFFKKYKVFQFLPGPLVVVIAGVVLNDFLMKNYPEYALKGLQLVSMPEIKGFSDIGNHLVYPDFDALFNFSVIKYGLIIAIVASLESLLSVEAADALDPERRVTPTNRELIAQGSGNLVSGMLGGLPITAVVVRTSANISAGAKTKLSAVFHGLLLFILVCSIPDILSMIPKASLAAVLLYVGYKLSSVGIIRGQFKRGFNQFIPFAVTALAILFTNLLVGILIGLVIGLIFVLRTNFHAAVFITNDGNNYLIRFNKDVSFLNKALVRKYLRSIPAGSSVIIDGSAASFIDFDIQNEVAEYKKLALEKGIMIELRNMDSL